MDSQRCIRCNNVSDWPLTSENVCYHCSTNGEEVPVDGASFSISINGKGISVKGASSKTIADIVKNVGVVSSKHGMYTGPMKPIDVTEFIKASNAVAKNSVSVFYDMAERVAAPFRDLFGTNENQDMSGNLYAGISKERLQKIRKEIEKELKPEMVKKITTQVTKEIKARDAKKLSFEDVRAAKAYFRDVELKALAMNYVLSRRYKEYEGNFVKFATLPKWWTTALIQLPISVILGICVSVLGLPVIFAIGISFLLNILILSARIAKAVNASRLFNETGLKQLKDDMRESACLAQLANTSRTVSMLSVKNSDDLHELIEEVKADHYRLNTSVLDAEEYEKALDTCQVRIADLHDENFMDRLKISQAEAEAEEAQELLPQSRMFKS